jgi:hypothetical protein
MSFLSVAEAAKIAGCPRRAISDAIYRGHLDEGRCPVVAGRRLIPRDYLPDVIRILAERGVISQEAATPCK